MSEEIKYLEKSDRYQSLAKLGNVEVEGITEGECFIFSKLDGTNARMWCEDGKLCFGSRNRVLSLDSDNAGFMAQFHKDERFLKYFKENPKRTLYGEFLVPHSFKQYRDDAWRKFYVFDILEDGKYYKYEEYSEDLRSRGIDYVPLECIIDEPLEENLVGQLFRSTFLLKDGVEKGEGIVVKNYDFVNRFGRVQWAKIVSNEFKETHKRVNNPLKITIGGTVERSIVEKGVTKALVEKEKEKIVADSEFSCFENKHIPKLLGTVFYCLLSEEMPSLVYKLKLPTVDFRVLKRLCDRAVKKFANF